MLGLLYGKLYFVSKVSQHGVTGNRAKLPSIFHVNSKDSICLLLMRSAGHFASEHYIILLMKKAKLIFDEQQVKEQIYRTRKLKCKKISKNFIIFRFEKNAFYRNDHYIDH